MSREFGRAERVADYLKRELSLLIQNEVRDPRVQMANVNEVEVTRDLSLARVFVTFVGETDETTAKDRVAVLNKAAGFLRSRIAQDSMMRSTPKLRFEYDASVQRGSDISALIDRALEEDRQHHDRQGDSPEGAPQSDEES